MQRKDFLASLVGIGGFLAQATKVHAANYDIQGKITDVLSGNGISHANLIFQNGNELYDNIHTDSSGNFTTSIDTLVAFLDPDGIIDTYALSGAYPSLTKGITNVLVNIPKRSSVKIDLINALGQQVDIPQDKFEGNYFRGKYHVGMDLGNLANGHYFIRLKTPQGSIIQRVTKTDAGMDGYYHQAADANLSNWKFLNKVNTNDWTLTINHPDYFERKTRLNLQENSNNIINENMIQKDFDMADYDVMTERFNGSGTKRMPFTPKLYIIDGPLEGYSGYESPASGDIDRIINLWKNKIKELSDGQLNVQDNMIYIGHNINDPTLQQAVDTFYDTGATPNIDNSNTEIWDLINFTYGIPGNGDHGEWIKDSVIVGARQRYRPGCDDNTIIIEPAQSMGFGKDPPDETIWKDNGNYTQFFYDCGKFHYSRPAGTMPPDDSTNLYKFSNC